MDSFELSKLLGAVCVALLLIVGPKTIIEMNQHKSEKPGYTLPEPAAAPAAADPAAAPDGKAVAAAESAANGKPAAAPAGDAPAAPAAGGAVAALAAASAENGKAGFAKCSACHSSQKGGPNGVGPNLWGVIGRKVGGHDGFGYSEALKKKGAEGMVWDLPTMIAWVQGDDKVIAGNKMVFAGIKDAAAAADLVAYINTLSDNPAAPPK